MQKKYNNQSTIGEANSPQQSITRGLQRDLNNFTSAQRKAYVSCLKTFKGLSHKESQGVLWALLEAVSQNSIVG